MPSGMKACKACSGEIEPVSGRGGRNRVLCEKCRTEELRCLCGCGTRIYRTAWNPKPKYAKGCWQKQPGEVKLPRNKQVVCITCGKEFVAQRKSVRFCSRECYLPHYQRGATDRHLQHYFGITLEEYDAKLEEQGGVCAICGGTTERRLAQDHCHKTGKNRDLLCDRCNRGLGFFDDDEERLMKAAEYVRRHREAGELESTVAHS